MADKIRVDRNQLKSYSDKLRASSELLVTFLGDLKKEIDTMSNALEGSTAEVYKNKFSIINNTLAKKLEDMLDNAANEMDIAVKMLLDADKDLARKLGMARDARGIKPVLSGKVNTEASNFDLRTTFGTADLKVGLTQCVGDPVNAATGNFILKKNDITIDGYTPIVFKRFYNAMDNWHGEMGRNWHHNYEIKLKRVSESIVEVTSEDGYVEYFILREDGWYSTEPEKKNKLNINENEEYILKRADKTVLFFSKEGVFVNLKNETGNLTRIHYTDCVNIEKIENNFGSLFFKYNDNQITKVTDNTGRFLEYGYLDGNLISVKGIEGCIYRYEYDDKNRLTRITNPLNNVTVTNIYDENGRTIEQTMADGTVNKFGYNDADGSTVFTEGNGIEVIYRRDDRFRIYETVYVNGSEKLTFNDNNQITSFTDKNKNTYYYKYDLFGNLASETNPLGYVTEYSYDDDNRPVSIKNPDGSIYSYSYDADGNIDCIKDPLGRKLNNEYNDSGQPVKILLPNESFYAVTYDDKGNPVEVKDPCGNISRLQFDELNRVRSVTKPEGNKMEFEYTPASKVKKVIYPDGTFEKAVYDQRGLVIEEINTNGYSVKNRYNSMGKLIEKENPLGGITKFEYDSMYRLVQMTNTDMHGNMLENFRYKYDAVGNRTAIFAYRGLNGSIDGETLYRYDSLNQLIEVENSDKTVERYFYDSIGNRVRLENWNAGTLIGAVDYKYDIQARLTEIIGKGRNIPGSSTHTIMEYDKRGNLLNTVTNGILTGKNIFNSANQLASAINKEGNVINFIYDGLGRRVDLHYEDNIQHYVLDATKPYHNILMTYDKNLKTESFTHGLDLTSVSSCNDTLYYMNDALGSPVSIFDNSGSVVSRYGYDAFGVLSVLQNKEQCQVHNIIGYTGYQNDSITGLQYAQARYYMPG